MSTMYYTVHASEPIGQVNAKPKGQGYHFTWCMYPHIFLDFVLSHPLTQGNVIDEYGVVYTTSGFLEVVNGASSHSLEEGIE